MQYLLKKQICNLAVQTFCNVTKQRIFQQSVVLVNFLYKAKILKKLKLHS